MLIPRKHLLTAKDSQVKSWFHFPQRVTVYLIPAINWIPGGKDWLSGLCQLHCDYEIHGMTHSVAKPVII